MGLRWRVNGRRTLWRSVKMTFRELTVLQEKSRMRTIRAQLCTRWKRMAGTIWITARNGSRPEMNCGRKWIAARDGSRPERDWGRGWMTRDGSRPEMDRGRIWISTGYGWMTGGGWQEMDHGRWMTINLLSYMKLRSSNRARICRHTVFQRSGSTEYDAKHSSEHYSEHYSEIPNHAPTCPSSNAEYDPESDPELQLQCRYRTSRSRMR